MAWAFAIFCDHTTCSRFLGQTEECHPYALVKFHEQLRLICDNVLEEMFGQTATSSEHVGVMHFWMTPECVKLGCSSLRNRLGSTFSLRDRMLTTRTSQS